MTKIDIFSGFLGAGKTTLIKKLIKEAYSGEKLVLIENEFGDIGIDGGFMKDAGIEVNEMNSGCICCSLVGDFGKALKKVMDEYSPDRILIEPSGVGKLSDIVKAVNNAEIEGAVINSTPVVVDASKCRIYMKNFGEFYIDQVKNTNCIILSHTKGMSKEKIEKAIELLREKNDKAEIIVTDWTELDGKTILETIENKNSMESFMSELEEELKHHHHHHHDGECDDPDCHCHEHHEHHHHDGECHDPDCHCHDHHEHEHHHHDGECDDPDCHCHEHHEHEHHHHDHGEHECHDDHCSCGHDHHHHDHAAADVFTSWGRETVKTFTKEELENILEELQDEGKYGMVLRAKGILESDDGKWLHFDYVPGEPDIRYGSASIGGRLCVIGSKLNEAALSELFGV